MVLFTQHSFSYNCVYDFFFSHFYLRGHGIFMWCVSLQTPLCFPPAMPPFDFPQLYALAAGGALGALMHRSLDVTIRQMLLSPLPITYGPPALKHSLFISAQALWLGWKASNVKINGFVLCLQWLVGCFWHISLICWETQDMTAP